MKQQAQQLNGIRPSEPLFRHPADTEQHEHPSSKSTN